MTWWPLGQRPVCLLPVSVILQVIRRFRTGEDGLFWFKYLSPQLIRPDQPVFNFQLVCPISDNGSTKSIPNSNSQQTIDHWPLQSTCERILTSFIEFQFVPELCDCIDLVCIFQMSQIEVYFTKDSGLKLANWWRVFVVKIISKSHLELPFPSSNSDRSIWSESIHWSVLIIDTTSTYRIVPYQIKLICITETAFYLILSIGH